MLGSVDPTGDKIPLPLGVSEARRLAFRDGRGEATLIQAACQSNNN